MRTEAYMNTTRAIRITANIRLFNLMIGVLESFAMETFLTRAARPLQSLWVGFGRKNGATQADGGHLG